MKKTLLTSLMALLPFMASADIIEVDGIYYDVSNSTLSATIVAPPEDNPTGAPVVYSGDIFIPDMVEYQSPTDGSTMQYKVVAVGDSAFTDCTGLTAIVLSPAVLDLGNYAFSGCTSMQSITMAGVQSIGKCTFLDCISLVDMNLAEMTPSLQSIGELAFSRCYGLTSLTLNEGLQSIGSFAFNGCQPMIFNIMIPSTVTSIGNAPFNSPVSLTVADGNPIYDSRDNCGAIIETASNSLVQGSYSTTIPTTVTSIGNYAFYNQQGLGNIVIPESVTRLGYYAFAGSSLESLDVPEGVTDIYGYVCLNCSTLTTVTLPSTLTYLGQSAFYGCMSLQTVTCNAATVPTTESNAFNESNVANATLNVPSSALSSYQTTAPWSQFATVTGTFDPDNPFEPETDYNVLANLTQMGAWDFVVPVTISHEGPSYAKIDLTPEMISEVNMALASDDGSTNTTLKALASEGILTDSLTAPGGYWLDGNGYVCAPDAADRKLSIEVTGDETTSQFYLTVQPEAYQMGASIQEHIYFTNGEKYWDVNFILQFEEQKYLVAFIADSVVLKSDSLEYGMAISAPVVPEKTGYRFTGWDPVFEEGAIVMGDAVYTAQYMPRKYMVTFIVDNETIQADSLTYGTAITVPTPPEKVGYTFTGWSPYPVVSTVPANDVTYIAQYTINTHTVTFLSEDGTTISSETMPYGTAITAPEVPTKTGYTFTGWSPAMAETVPDSSVTYTAQYKINKYLMTFTVDGVVFQQDSLEYGSAMVVPDSIPVKEGYTFNSWGGGILPATVPAHDETYAAYFDINSYNWIFMVDDSVVHSGVVAYGSSLLDPGVSQFTVKEGYTFSGWTPYPWPETMPAEDLIIRGYFTINKYLVTFTDIQGTLSADSLEYAQAITAPTAREQEGYTFMEWVPAVDATVPSHDVTYTAEYVINSYKVAFIADGDTIQSQRLNYGTAITAPEAPTKTGYTFTGWSPAVDATVPANDVTYTAQYTVNSYQITFTDAQGQISSESLAYGTQLSAPTAREKEGYTFTGWLPEVPETVPADNVTYEAQYTINSYLVTFKADSLTLRADSMAYGTAITAPEVPTKTGYTFTGWSPAVDATVPANDVTYTAQYTINSYQVTFKMDNDSVISSTTLEYGEAITKPANPTKTGYTFTGWTPEVAATVPNSSVTYTATFSINSYKLVYQVDGVTVDSTLVEYGTAITPIEKPTREGANFSGWFNLPEGNVMPDHDVTVTGTFSTNAYKVTFIADGSTYSETVVEYGTAILLPTTNPTKEGYTFTGWGAVPETMPAQDITLTAQFSINSYRVKFVIDGDTIQSTSMEYGSPITTPTVDGKEGCTFSGWSPAVDETVPARDVIYEAEYIPNTYLVRFVVDGTTVKSDSLTYGTAIIAPNNPVKEGYTFRGWGPDSVATTVPANDVTYTAQWEINSYKLVYKVDGVTVDSIVVDYGAPITEAGKPTREGAEFQGWFGFPESGTMPANDVTVTGTFSTNAYKVTFMVDGNTYNETMIAYGTAIPLPETSPAKEGHTFAGWGEVPETMPAYDVTCTAQWIINSYFVKFVIDGDTIQSTSLEYGSPITAPTVDGKEGCTFSGWLPAVDETVPARDVIYEAEYIPNTYLVRFVVDGTTVKSDSLTYGTAIIAPNNPTKEGHTFAGWNPQVDATVPAHDVTYVAEWDIDPALIEVHDDLIAAQTALNTKKDSIDVNYNAGANKYRDLVLEFADVIVEAAPFANKFAADTVAIRQQLNALQTPIEAYNQYPVRNFTNEIEELYNERTLLSQQERLEEEMQSASDDLNALSDSVDAVVAAINNLETAITDLRMSIASARVTPINGIATVVNPMGGLDAILQDKENVKKLTITGKMEGDDFAALLNVVNVEELTLPAVNSKTDSIRLGGLGSLLVVNLEEANTVLEDKVFTGCNPNLMVYAQQGANIGVLNCNVILNGEAEEIVLTDGYPVRIPDAFSAQRISYTRSFNKKTYIGQSAGWETLVLPFTVENITTQDGRSIAPFGQQADANFWLGTVINGENGFNAAESIEANKPYILAMPNNGKYTANANITGNVTFSATDVVVSPTIGAEPIIANYNFTPVYEGEPDYENIYAINDDDYQSYYPGSVFVRSLRAVRPFEAYITIENGAKRRDLIPIGINSATGLMQIAAEQNGQLDGVYSLDGRKVAETTDNLPAGIYIVGGKKYIVR